MAWAGGAVLVVCCCSFALGHIESTGHFSASQAGNSFSKVNSVSDTRTGLTHAQTRGVMANYGKLRGHTDVKSAAGMSSALYAADLHGKGGLWADSQSQDKQGYQAAITETRGFINKGGYVSGSVGSSGKPNSYAPGYAAPGYAAPAY